MFELRLRGESDLEHDLGARDAEPADLDTFRNFLRWCLPLSERDLEQERIRLALIDRATTDPRIEAFLDRIEERMRALIRRHVAPLVSSESVETYVSLFRAITNGAVLGAAEHPAKWTAERQLAVVDSYYEAGVRHDPARLASELRTACGP